MNSLLSTKNLTVGYAKKPVASGINLDIFPGEIIVLIGPNGTGKTTILRTIAGLLPPIAGSLLWEGKEWLSLPADERAKHLSVCLTERMDAKRLRCFEVVGMGRYPYTGRFGTLTEKDASVVMESLARVGMEAFSDTPFEALSDGQKQLILLARACAQEPELLVLDEPTSFLDVSHKLQFVDVLKQMVRQKGMAVLASLHELEMARILADRIVRVTNNGEVFPAGPPQEVLTEEAVGALYGIDPERLKDLYVF